MNQDDEATMKTIERRALSEFNTGLTGNHMNQRLNTLVKCFIGSGDPLGSMMWSDKKWSHRHFVTRSLKTESPMPIYSADHVELVKLVPHGYLLKRLIVCPLKTASPIINAQLATLSTKVELWI